MTSLCSTRPSRHSRRGRLLSLALYCLAGLALPLASVVDAHAQGPAAADLTVTKSGDETARVGGTITYNISVSNGGPDAASNVVLSDPIPANTTFVSADVTVGDGAVSFDGTTLTVTFDSLAAPEPENETIASGGVTLVVMVNGDVPRGTVISNTVTGRSDASDPQMFDNTATATTVITGPFAGDILISEFRLRGPAGTTDEYIEIYNNADTPHLVNATDGSGGYAVAASDGVTRCVIPNNTVLPARGHFLCVNETGYSLDLYPAGDSEVPTATGDLTYTADIPDNAGLAVFRTSDAANFNLANRFDAVGSTSVTNDLYREGTGYPALSPLGLDYAFYRDNCGKAGSVTVFGPCPAAGLPRDTDNNAADFVFVSPDGSSSGAGARLGAPGPENISSPTQRNASFGVTLLDPCAGSASPPNRARSFTQDPTNNSTFGTLDIRRTVTNATGQNVTRLRWRIIDITTHPAPNGIADLRARTSTPLAVTVDRAPCGSATSEVIVQGTTLEQPPLQTNGGGFNSTLSSGTVTLETPLADGESIDVRFLLGIQRNGSFKFFINIEALTREPVIVPEEETASPSAGAPVGPSVRPRKGLTALPTRASESAPSAGGSRGAGAPPASRRISAPPARVNKGVRTPPARARLGRRE